MVEHSAVNRMVVGSNPTWGDKKIMLTAKQLCNSYKRIRKKHRTRTPALEKSPQKKGICIKALIVKPKKPNSAQRKIAKINIKFGQSKKKIFVSIPGQGHNLRQYSAVLMRGGRSPDLPGIRYRLIRGKLDFEGLKNRVIRRSFYGTKKQK